MSEDGFHVHGPHDHELEHATQAAAAGKAHGDAHGDAHGGGHGGAHGGGGMVNQIAMFTAIIATVGALFSYMGGATQANAGLYKNNAALSKASASDQWNFYQAKSTKQALAELARDLAPANLKDTYKSKAERYDKEKADIKATAEKFDTESDEWNHKSDEQMHEHHRWAQATTILQISIALAAIALLTRKKWLEYAMFGTGAAGLGIGVVAFLHF